MFLHFSTEIVIFCHSTFLDALASLDFKLSVSESFTFFTANASTFRVIFFYNVLGSLQLPSQTILPPVPFPMQCIFALHLFSQFVCVPPTCLPTILFLNTTFKEQVCPTSFPVPHYNLSFLVKSKTVFHPKNRCNPQ